MDKKIKLTGGGRTAFELFIKHDNQSNKGIYAVSEPVSAFSEAVKRSLRELKWFDDNMSAVNGKQVDAWSLSDCQVTLKPSKFFIVHEELFGRYGLLSRNENKQKNRENFYFPSRIIYNAEILEAPEKIETIIPKRNISKSKEGEVITEIKQETRMTSNEIYIPEACSSFPMKRQKNITRFYKIKVRYQIKSWYGFRTITEWVYGLKSHIFQHEVQHSKGENIYYHRIEK